MIYTIGNKANYDRFFVEQAAEDGPHKLGRTENYQGGIVFETEEIARRYLKGMPCGEDYDVYGVLADWENDTTPEGTAGEWHDLLVTAKLVKLK